MTDTSYLYEYFMEKSTDDKETKNSKRIVEKIKIKDSNNIMKEDSENERVLPA